MFDGATGHQAHLQYILNKVFLPIICSLLKCLNWQLSFSLIGPTVVGGNLFDQICACSGLGLFFHLSMRECYNLTVPWQQSYAFLCSVYSMSHNLRVQPGSNDHLPVSTLSSPCLLALSSETSGGVTLHGGLVCGGLVRVSGIASCAESETILSNRSKESSEFIEASSKSLSTCDSPSFVVSLVSWLVKVKCVSLYRVPPVSLLCNQGPLDSGHTLAVEFWIWVHNAIWLCSEDEIEYIPWCGVCGLKNPLIKTQRIDNFSRNAPYTCSFWYDFFSSPSPFYIWKISCHEKWKWNWEWKLLHFLIQKPVMW